MYQTENQKNEGTKSAGSEDRIIYRSERTSLALVLETTAKLQLFTFVVCNGAVRNAEPVAILGYV